MGREAALTAQPLLLTGNAISYLSNENLGGPTSHGAINTGMHNVHAQSNQAMELGRG